MPAIYFSLGHVQPFADMETEVIEEGVTVVRGDGKLVGLRLETPASSCGCPRSSSGSGSTRSASGAAFGPTPTSSWAAGRRPGAAAGPSRRGRAAARGPR